MSLRDTPAANEPPAHESPALDAKSSVLEGCPADLHLDLWTSFPYPVLIAETETGRIVSVNGAATQRFDLVLTELHGRTIYDVLQGGRERSGPPLGERRTQREPASSLRSAPPKRAVAWDSFPLRNAGCALTAWVFRSPRKVARAARRDPLTGLADRRHFDLRLKRAFRRAEAGRDLGFSILFVDLDRFKPVNDRHGHPIGDRVLRIVAERLVHCVRPPDTVSRRGGDEFTILLEAVAEAGLAKRVAERILRSFETPMVLDGCAIGVSASVGISVYSTDHAEPEEMLADADVSMYRVKRAGGEGYAYGFTRRDRIAAL
ncbi:MAG TPA: GGDEF domain-containing protein [Pirellulales bacterium]|jgi:diguanylate cyclase (GGDEF)-like protein|nr:GGDEF domain-containing protein [Pirellulales bacterium]